MSDLTEQKDPKQIGVEIKEAFNNIEKISSEKSYYWFDTSTPVESSELIESDNNVDEMQRLRNNLSLDDIGLLIPQFCKGIDPTYEEENNFIRTLEKPLTENETILYCKKRWSEHLERLEDEKYRLRPEEMVLLEKVLADADVIPQASTIQKLKLGISPSFKRVGCHCSSIDFKDIVFSMNTEEYFEIAKKNSDLLRHPSSYEISRYVGAYNNEPFDEISVQGGIPISQMNLDGQIILREMGGSEYSEEFYNQIEKMKEVLKNEEKNLKNRKDDGSQNENDLLLINGVGNLLSQRLHG